MAEQPRYEVGYGRPPKDTQFPPGRSGNSRGRPRGRVLTLPYETVLGREVTIIEDGVRKRVPAEEAFLLNLVNAGLEKGGSLRRLALHVLQKPQARKQHSKQRLVIYTIYAAKGEVGKPMRALKMASMLSPFQPSAKLVIEPWLVQAALSRLGERRFTAAEQKIIITATRRPHAVKWPEWWEEKY